LSISANRCRMHDGPPDKVECRATLYKRFACGLCPVITLIDLYARNFF
jgi:hypothetical protein